jgi:hypothetical protein
MSTAEKRPQPRSSWWQASTTSQSWLGSARNKLVRNVSVAPSADIRFGIKQAPKK